MWRLAALVQARTVEARNDAEHFREVALSVPEVDSDELRRARNQFANRFLTMLGVTLFLMLLFGLLGGPLAALITLPLLPLGLIAGGAIVFWLVAILLKYYRRRSRFLAQARLLLHQQRDAVRQCREAVSAEHRLSGIYEQLVDWGEILGYAVHDPWQPKDAWFSGRPEADLLATLPSCVDVAVPDPADEAGFQRLKSTAMRSLAGTGWRTRAFNVQLERLLERQHAENTSAVAAQLDLDSPATPNGYRSLMLTLLRENALQSASAEHILRSKAAEIYADQDTLVHHALVPVNSEYAAEATDLLDEGTGLEFMRPEWGDFLAGALSGTTQFSLNLWSDEGQASTSSRQHVMTLAYAPPRMSHNVETPHRSVIPTLAADVNRGVELSARCDFGPPVEKHHLRLFTGSKADISWPEPASDQVTTSPLDVSTYN
jgi:hypothetical protein